MTKKIIFIFLLTFFLKSLVAQDPPKPDIRCISIDVDQVTLSWNIHLVGYDTTEFKLYHIYKSYDGTFWQRAGSTGNTDSTFTYTEDLAQSSRVYYYMESQISAGNTTSPPSETVSSIFLTLLNTGVEPIANLSWNHLSQDLTGLYHIFRKDESSDWKLIDSTMSPSYQDTITYPYCEDTTLYYKVEITDPAIGCTSTSTIVDGFFVDGFVPGNNIDIVEMDSVSVAYNGFVSISWEPFAVKDLSYYIIFRNDLPPFGTWLRIDTVPGNVLNYEDVSKLANEKVVSYRIQAVDSCDKGGLGGYQFAFETIFLDTIRFDYCDTSISLSWNPMEDFDPPVQGYEIYEFDTTTKQSVLIDIVQESSYEYTWSFQPDSTYCYYIRAFNAQNKTSSSCIQCKQIDRPDQPDYLNFIKASVDTSTNNSIILTINVDTDPFGTKCIIYRKTDQGAPYDSITTIPIIDNNPIIYNDHDVEVSTEDYYYKIIIIDECNHRTYLPDNENHTIHLSGYSVDKTTNILNWNFYESTVAEVLEYRLIRLINDTVNTVITLSSSTNNYEDDISQFWESGGRFSYLVEARIKLDTSPPEIDSLSVFSNETNVAQISGIIMPNAFTPNFDGINDTYGPVNYFPDEGADFIFLIYNRWGQKIYETTNITNAYWDGNFEGQPSPTGVFIYYLYYSPSENQQFEEKGTFTLLR